MSGWVRTLRCGCLKSCIQVSPIRTKDLHNISVRITIGQLKQIGPCGQDLAGDLNRLTKCNCGCLVRLVSVSSEFEKKSKGNDQSDGNVTFVDFHFVHLLEKFLLRP